MIGVKGRVQREGEVVHILAQELIDLSAELSSVGARDADFLLLHGGGDEFHHGSPGTDPLGDELEPWIADAGKASSYLRLCNRLAQRHAL